MVSILSLWLPILLSAVAVFIVSSLIHMVLGYHGNDFKKIPSEDEVMDNLRRQNIPPGDYMIPCPADRKQLNTQEFKDKVKKGPSAVMTIFPPGVDDMVSSLMQWFIYLIIIGIFAAYIAGRALPAGAHYLDVFMFAGCTAFAGYSLALMQNSIWFKKSWVTTIKSMIDGLIYALITAGFFGWLWPGGM